MKDIVLVDGRRLQPEELLGSGSFGAVWAVKGEPLVAKLFQGAPDATLDDRLRAVVHEYRCDWLEPDCNGLQCWPRAIIAEPRPGLLMPRVPDGMVPLSKLLDQTPLRALQRLPVSQRSYRTRIDIGLHLCDALAILHGQGLCHGDLSPNNIYFDPTNGQIRLIDLDGLAVPGYVQALQAGTLGYIAPEIEAGGGAPSIMADLHALAALLHGLLLLHHPFEGVHVFSPDGDSDQDRVARYGYGAIWNLNPADDRNRPTGYTSLLLPDDLGAGMTELFGRALVLGLKRPGMRPSADSWLRALADLRDNLVPCVGCAAGVGWMPWLYRERAQACWACKQQLERRGWTRLEVFDQVPDAETIEPDTTRRRTLVIYPGFELYPRHLRSGWSCSPTRNLQPLARVVSGRRDRDWMIDNGTTVGVVRQAGRGVIALKSPVKLSEGSCYQLEEADGARLLRLQAPSVSEQPETIAPSLRVSWRDCAFEVACVVGRRGLVIDLDRFKTGRSRGHPAGRVYWTSGHGWRLSVFKAPRGKRLERSDRLPLAEGILAAPPVSTVHLGGQRLLFQLAPSGCLP